jgi:hypothetical protein
VLVGSKYSYCVEMLREHGGDHHLPQREIAAARGHWAMGGEGTTNARPLVLIGVGDTSPAAGGAECLLYQDPLEDPPHAATLSSPQQRQTTAHKQQCEESLNLPQQQSWKGGQEEEGDQRWRSSWCKSRWCKDDQGDGDEKLCAFQPAKITWSLEKMVLVLVLPCFSQQKMVLGCVFRSKNGFSAVFFAAKMVLGCVFRRFVRASWNACRPRLNNSFMGIPTHVNRPLSLFIISFSHF